MIKVKLFLVADEDIPHSGWKKGDRLEMTNDIFDKRYGIAYWQLDNNWTIESYELLENDPNKLND